MLKVVIVEDNLIVGKTARENLINRGYDVVLYPCARDAIDGIAADNLPDIMLVDIRLPDRSGVELTHIIKEKYSQVEIIMHTVIEDIDTLLEAVSAGASGYIVKTQLIDTDELVNSIETVMKGGAFMTGVMARKILNHVKGQTRPDQTRPDQTRPDQTRPEPLAGTDPLGMDIFLSPKEKEVLESLAKGLCIKDIAKKQNVTVDAVNFHIKNIYKKYKVSSRAELMAMFVRQHKGD